MTQQPLISVVICTRNRASELAYTLESLARDRSEVSAEVLVVDNVSTDHTVSVVRGMTDAFPRQLSLMTQPRIGHSAGRNAGVRAAVGEWIVYTDDDVEIRPGWLDGMARYFDPGVTAVGGRVIPTFLAPRPPWLDGFPIPATLIDHGEASFDMDERRLPMGANMAFRAAVLRPLLPEPFSEKLGHNGKIGMGWEETHLIQQLMQGGHRIVYSPEAVIEHRIEGSRLGYEAVRRSFVHLGLGLGRVEQLRGSVPLGGRARSVVRGLRAYRRALILRHANSRVETPSPDQAEAEFWAYAWTASHIEKALFGLPWLSQAIATRLA
jgi:glycosyltransferase involved in cell wall biosynthesis